MDRQSAGTNSDLDHSTNDLIRRIHSDCSLPTAEELDSKECHICKKPFFTTRRPELPVKLGCGHIFGASCLLKWLDPLSGEGHDSCPLCRRQVLGDPEPDHEAIRRTLLSMFDATVPRSSIRGRVDMDDTIVTWMKGAQDLYEDMCANLVTVLADDTEDPEKWIRLLPAVLEVINTLTWERFAMGSYYDRLAASLGTDRPRLAERILGPFLRYVANLEHLLDHNVQWLLGRHHAEIYGTAYRIGDYYRRIREAHATMSYRLHAALEPDDVQDANSEARS